MITSPLSSYLLSATIHLGVGAAVAWHHFPVEKPVHATHYHVIFEEKPQKNTKLSSKKTHPPQKKNRTDRSSLNPETLDSHSRSIWGSLPHFPVSQGAQPEVGNPLPQYPLVARKKKHEGLVKLTLNINKSGKVDEVILLKSSGYWELDQVATETVQEWIFTPAHSNGTAIAGEATVSFDFKLTGISMS